MPDNPHQVTLQRLLEGHRQDLADLREQSARLRRLLRRRPPWPDEPKPGPSRSALESDLADVERSIAKHVRLIALGDDAHIGELLQSLATHPDLAREAAADPYAFATRHDIDLPATTDITLLVVDRDMSARIRNLDPDMPFEATWTQDGFQAPPDTA
ncbi:hypothetical protein ACQB60_20395 [Actinomycetota bacterium Odt1-20B]